jgi:hypothetical protein
MTQNAQFIAQQLTSSTLALYEYDSATDNYIKIRIFTQFITTLSLVYASENASMVFGACGRDNTVFFDCNVQYCASCSFFNYCQACLNGYTLINGICTCSAT